MGGVAGHLSHLYDNRELTFNEMKKILSLASSGDLIGTEKTDGYNIFLGFKDGQPRAARNKGDMQRGGMSTDELAAREFKGGAQVKKVYNDAFRAYEKAVRSLTPAEQEMLFGLEGEIFYNTEIQGPGASNVVNYDANVLSIHHAGHRRYNAETNQVEVVDATENSKILDKAVDRFEAATADEPFSVRRTAFLELKQLDDDYDLQICLAKIKKAGFEGSMTIEQYLEQKILYKLNSELSYFSEQLRQDIVDRILKKEEAPTLSQIYKGFPPDQKQIIREFVNNGNSYIKEAILPIEEAIHDFAVELLRGLESAYVLDNNAEVSRVKAEVEEAIKQIQSYEGEHSDELQDILAQQLRKIKHIDNINTTVEGFVFQYGDQLYKFTGNFAPVNQLLGLFRYGRGAIPPIKKAEIQEQGGDDTPEELTRRKIAVIPGKFKPPHKGHLKMVEHYASVADVVVILISPLSRTTESGVEISLSESRQIWEVYLANSEVDTANVIIAKSPFNSPVQSSYELVAGNIKGFIPVAGDLIIPGASTKPDPKSGVPDTERFARFHQIPAENKVPGVVPAHVEDYAFNPHGDEMGDFSARDFRDAIDSGDLYDLQRFIPDSVNAESILDIVYDGNPPQKKTLTMESLYSLVEEAFNNIITEVSSEKQRRWACSQIDNPRELTKKQAKEMCSSKVEEQELYEGIGDTLSKYFPSLKKLVSKAEDILTKTSANKEKRLKMHKEMSQSHPWYPAYIDPIKDWRKLNDVLEILSGFSTKMSYGEQGQIIPIGAKGKREFLPGKFQKWIDDVGLSNGHGDLPLFKEWYLKQYVPSVIVQQSVERAQQRKQLSKTASERERQFQKTGSARLPGEESYMDRVYRIAQEKGLTPQEVMSFLEESSGEERFGLDTPTQAARRGNVKEMSAMGAGAVAGGGKTDAEEEQTLIREED